METPKIILLFSGKRKSGKDYFGEKINSLLGNKRCSILRLSEPLKRIFAKNHNLDLKELLSDGPYKEIHRYNMIKWGEEVRSKDPGFFCKAACDNAPIVPVWIVCDIRRKTDIYWFIENYGSLIKTVRISADIEVRQRRGFKFTSGVDDAESECDLDDLQNWDIQVTNNNLEDSENSLQTIMDLIESYC